MTKDEQKQLWDMLETALKSKGRELDKQAFTMWRDGLEGYTLDQIDKAIKKAAFYERFFEPAAVMKYLPDKTRRKTWKPEHTDHESDTAKNAHAVYMKKIKDKMTRVEDSE